MQPNIDELKNIAGLFYKAGQTVSDAGIFPYFSEFPVGWCGTMSGALGGYLRSLYPNERIKYVCGCYGHMSHAWINISGIIIDLTPKQFEFCDDDIIVCKENDSVFHKTFEVSAADIRDCTVTDMHYYEESIIIAYAMNLSKKSVTNTDIKFNT